MVASHEGVSYGRTLGAHQIWWNARINGIIRSPREVAGLLGDTEGYGILGRLRGHRLLVLQERNLSQ